MNVTIGHDVYSVPDGCSIHLNHFHRNNSTKSERKGGQYRTVAQIVDANTNEVLAEADAICGRHDTPTRERGRRIAIGRCLARFHALG